MPDHMDRETRTTDDEALAELQRGGEEAGVGTVMKVLELTEQHYYAAVATTTPRTHFVTRSNTAPG